MARLRILGQAEVSAADGSPLGSVAAQPKLLALLAYLSLARRRTTPRRDTLLALFWPELENNAARHALSQALTKLRNELGDGVVNGRYRETIDLASGAFWCDACAFRDAMQRDEFAAALELYRGPLLDGFFLAGAPDFERWVEHERRDLQRLAVRAALELASRAHSAQQWSEACRWAERAIEIDPYDEAGWRTLIANHDAAGDRARGIAAFNRLRQLLSDDLDVDPSPETLQLISSVRARSSANARNGDGNDTGAAVRADVAIHGQSQSPRHRNWFVILAAAVIVLALTGLAYWDHAQASRKSKLVPNTVAIVPFRVSGLDSLQTAALQEGMVDLLALKLGVESGQRAVDPRATIHAWRRLLASSSDGLAADWPVALAAHLGAGNVVSGSVIGMQDRVVLNAILQSVPAGRVRGRATVSGAADSVISLVDRLAAKVLGLAAGEPTDRIESLATTSLPALQAYLAGRAAQRAGRFPESLHNFKQALELDSTFALAGIGMLLSSNWGMGAGIARQPAIHAAWAHRHRLSQRDSLRLLAMLGIRYPDPTPAREQIAFIERTLLSTPDDVELWFELGEAVFHNGPRIGIADWRERANAAFTRTLEFDSTFAPAIVHSIELAAEARDTGRLQTLAAEFNRQAPDGIGGPAHEWLARAVARSLRSRDGRHGDAANSIADFSDGDLRRVITFATSYAVGLDDADKALELLRHRGATAAERRETLRFAILLALARGRSNDAHRAWLSFIEQDSTPARRIMVRHALYYALYWDGSRESAAYAARILAPQADAPLAADSASRRVQFLDICALGHWRLSNGRTDDAKRAVQKLGTANTAIDGAESVREARICGEVLDVLIAASQKATIDGRRLVRLDAVLTDLPIITGLAPPIVRIGNLVSARFWAALGENQRALAALERRGHNTEARVEPAEFLREECRLAKKLGQRELAERSCDRYSALRPGM